MYINLEAAMLTRLQRKRNIKNKQYWLGSTLLTIAAIIILLYFQTTDYAVPVTAMSPFKMADAHSWPPWHDVLFWGIPGLQAAIEPPHPVAGKPQITPQSVLRDALLFLSGIDIMDVRSLFRTEIPVMALLGEFQSVKAITLPSLPKLNLRNFSPGDKPLVGIYHTHTAESFIPDSGADHRPGGQRGDIVDVGEAMVKRFAEHGVVAIQSKNIHDYPSFMKAYNKSEITVRQMVEENPSLQALFDIHRNAGKREETTAIVNGVPVARILIIVGKGQPGLEQPHWEQNYAFAKAIEDKLNQYYPGVSLGIDVVEWRYNQHLHPHALLFEMGCQYNTKEEVTRTIEMIADVVTEILAQ
jgi:stage II sporulation protein P